MTAIPHPTGRSWRIASSLLAGCSVVVAVGCGGSSHPRTAAAPPRSTTADAASSDTLPRLVARVQGGVIRVEADTCAGQSLGTGFLVGPRLVATVEHVVDGASKITLKQSGSTVGTGTVIGEDPARDVALVQSSAPIPGNVFRLAPRAPQLGESVAALGFPLGLPITVTKGSVSGTQRTIPIDGVSRRQLVQTDAAVNPGNSGGPLLSTDTGEVVGLVDIGTNQANGIAFAVSAQVAQPLLRAWQTAPQPIPAASCATSTIPSVAQSPPSGSLAAGANTYTGQAFSIQYPAGWNIKNAEKQERYGSDTTIVSPSDSNTLIRVDVTPHVSATDPQSAAQPVINTISQEPNYQQIDLSSDTFNGYPALHWEFTVTESGISLHKEDEFFIDGNGDAVAVLTQAPADAYPGLSSDLATLRQTLAMS